MKFKILLSVFCALAVFVAQSVSAENVYTCPDISKAVQVADCPSDEELRHMFSSTCGPSQKPDPNTKGLCASFESFKKKKNSALWESGDGEFMGYVSCSVPAAKIKQAKLIKIGLGQQRVMDKIICSYEGGTALTLRTRKSCRIPGAKRDGKVLSLDCSVAGNECKAICE